jgi:5-hydroxyisourate hydrolase-like protein (transthyretin family)
MTTKNTARITNFEASPQIMNAVGHSHGRSRVSQGTVALATTDIDSGDIIHLDVFPADARILRIWLAADDMDSGSATLTFNVGVYTVGAAVKDIDAFASAITLGQSVTALTDYVNEARNINEIGQKLFLDAADTLASHEAQYYISLTVSNVAATAVAGDLSWIIEYTID